MMINKKSNNEWQMNGQKADKENDWTTYGQWMDNEVTMNGKQTDEKLITTQWRTINGHQT